MQNMGEDNEHGFEIKGAFNNPTTNFRGAG